MKLFISLIALLLVACNNTDSSNKADLFSTENDVASQQVQELFPKGMAEDEVLKIMSDIGAEVTIFKNERWANHMLVGTIKNGSSEWQVGVSIMDGVVDTHTISISVQ